MFQNRTKSQANLHDSYDHLDFSRSTPLAATQTQPTQPAAQSINTVPQVGTLSRSSSRDSLHSLSSTNMNSTQRLSHNNDGGKRSLFSVVQTAKMMTKAVNKFTVNQVPITPVVKVPVFSNMVDREAYPELLSATTEYFDKLVASQTDSYALHVKTLDEFCAVMKDNIQVTT